MEKKILKTKVLYLLFLVGFFYKYINEAIHGKSGIYEILTRYFGYGKYVIFFILISNFYTMGMKEERRNRWTKIFYSSYIIYIAFMFFIASYKVHIMGSNATGDPGYNIFNILIFNLNTGLIGGYILSYIMLMDNPYIYWSFFVIFFGISLLAITFLVNFLMIRPVKILNEEYIKRIKLERAEEELIEQIAIKEALEKKERELIERREEAQEINIFEKFKNKSIPLYSNEENEEKKEKDIKLKEEKSINTKNDDKVQLKFNDYIDEKVDEVDLFLEERFIMKDKSVKNKK